MEEGMFSPRRTYKRYHPKMLWSRANYWAYKHIAQYVVRFRFRPGRRVATDEWIADYDSSGVLIGCRRFWGRHGTVVSVSKSPCGHYGVNVQWDAPGVHGNLSWTNLSNLLLLPR